MRALVSLLAAVVALLSCGAPQYAYSPARTTGAEIAGTSAASYDIPSDAPRGHVRVAVFGVGPLEDAPAARAVHVGLVISNDSSEMWRLLPSEQRIELADGEDDVETVYSTIAQSPAIEIAPGTSRQVDLAFPLPARVESESSVPELNAVWVVHAGARVVTYRTPFERFRVGPVSRPRMPLAPGEP